MKALSVLRGKVRKVDRPTRRVLLISSPASPRLAVIRGTPIVFETLLDRLTPRPVTMDGVEEIRLFARWYRADGQLRLHPEDVLGLAGVTRGYTLPGDAPS